MVLLDEHLHAILTLPEGDTRYPARWGYKAQEFMKSEALDTTAME